MEKARMIAMVLVHGLICGTIALAGEKETRIKFADAPAAVQKTMQEQAPGITIDELEKEVEDGKTVYEAEVVIDGKKYEIEVAEDGTLLEKEEDTDDAEDDDDDDDHEDKD